MEAVSNEIIIIGGGIAGLTCAIELEKRGFAPLIIEATDRVGGRVKTDIKNGFRLDHGFQVLLTAYPEARRYLNYDALGLKNFNPGAALFNGGSSFEISDPLRQPSTALTMLFSPIGGLGDKLKMASLASKLKKESISNIFKKDELTTLKYLSDFGFSDKIINTFFKPFFGGIYLENELNTSSRMFEFVFKMFSEGNAAVPAHGIEEIPKQLKSQLKKTSFRFNTKVQSVNDKVTLDNGETLQPQKVVIATQPEALMSGFSEKPEFQSVLNLYFSCNKKSINKPLIGLVPDEGKLINNFCDLTSVSEAYSASSQRLISVSVNDDSNTNISEKVLRELSDLTKISEKEFKFIDAYHIPKALPVNKNLKYEIPATEVKLHEDIFLAGDYLLNGSLNAAMLSGRTAAEAVQHSLSESVF